MDFEYDIFISYGWLDDDEDPDDDKGWVDLLFRRLPGQVVTMLGETPTIWRDHQNLQGNHELEGAILNGVTRSRLFLPIYSPRYVTSKWCRMELEAFCAAPPLRVAGVDSFESRIFKVVKSPLLFPHLVEKQPEQLRDLTGYDFYAMDGRRPDPFSPDTAAGKDKRYWAQLRRLGGDIADMLAKLKYGAKDVAAASPSVVVPAGVPSPSAPAASDVPAAQSATQPAPESPVAPTASPAAPTLFVYLAETAPDLAGERERVRDELRQRGYGVLPEQKLPLDERAKTEEAVRRDLARCVLSVHLVGAKYGDAPAGDARSVTLIQEELAAEREQADQSFQRLLWTPAWLTAPGVKVKDRQQGEVLAGLQRRVTKRTELLQASIEDLKTRIVEKLSAPAPAAPGDARRTRYKHVYLICEARDRPLVRPIRQYLFNEHQFEVVNLFADGTGEEKLADYHRRNLKECDATLIYFGNADEPWVRKNLDDIRKYGHAEDERAAHAVFVGQPPKEEKDDFLTREVLVIRNVSGFNPEDLSEFVRAVQRAGNGGTGA